MSAAPGQGFRTGLDVQFIAIPYPLPESMASELIKAGQRAQEARKKISMCKDGEKLKIVAAEKDHQRATSDLELIEISIRHEAGVVYTRPEFIANGRIK